MAENSNQPNYQFPVDLLLSIGHPGFEEVWQDYLALGFTEEHVPELIRMAIDPELNRADSESQEVYAPVHAWRALGQLRAQAAIEPLLELFHMFETEGGLEWAGEELPEVYGMIGAAAIPALSAYLLDDAHGSFSRINAADALRKIAEAHPDFRDQCVAPIMAALENYEVNDPDLNSMLIEEFIDLKDEQALPLIECVFASKRVDGFGFADWDDVQVEFGLKEPDPNRQRDFPESITAIADMLDRMARLPDEFGEPPLDQTSPTYFDDPGNSDSWLLLSERKAKAQAKSKRKQAAKSRKLNRKKRKK